MSKPFEGYDKVIAHLKKYNRDDLTALKKGYQLLNRIVSVYLEDKLNPKEKLNESYVKLEKFLYGIYSKIDSSLESFNIGSIYAETEEFALPLFLTGEDLYIPFEDLYSAGLKYKGLQEATIEDIKVKMSACLGDIVSLCLQCGVQDFISDSSHRNFLKDMASAISQDVEEKNLSNEDLHFPDEPNEWYDDFSWEGDTFRFGDYGEIKFSSQARKSIFKALTERKGDWASVREIERATGKTGAYIRSTISQIEQRLKIVRFPKRIIIQPSIVAEADKRPAKGSYRIRFISESENHT